MLFRLHKTDYLFGLMKFRGFFGAGFWEGEIDFAPAGRRIKIYVPGGRSGIPEKQREFYRELKARYASMLDEIDRILADLPDVYDGEQDTFASRDGRPAGDDFELESVTFPKMEDVERKWWLEYRYKKAKGRSTHIVNFEGWKLSYGEYDD